MAHIDGQERIVEIELAHRRPVGPGRPFGAVTALVGDTEQGGAAGARMGEGLGSCIGRRAAIEGSGRDRGVVDDAVRHHGRRGIVDRRRIGRDLGDLPRQLLLAGQRRGGRVNAYFVELHVIPQLPPGAPAKASSMDS